MLSRMIRWVSSVVTEKKGNERRSSRNLSAVKEKGSESLSYRARQDFLFDAQERAPAFPLCFPGETQLREKPYDDRDSRLSKHLG
jgi:hypothetical protein